MIDDSFVLKEPLHANKNRSKIFLDTPLFVFPSLEGHLTTSFTDMFHEEQHFIDLLSLFPSPLLNATIKNYLLLKAASDCFIEIKMGSKDKWAKNIKEYRKKIIKIKDNYYLPTEEGFERNYLAPKLAVTFETTAIEKELLFFLYKKRRDTLIHFPGRKGITVAAIAETKEYIKELGEGGLRYKWAFTLTHKFLCYFFEILKYPIRTYRDYFSLLLKATIDIPDLDSLVAKKKRVNQTFPLTPPIRRLAAIHSLNFPEMFGLEEDTSGLGKEFFKALLSEGKEKCGEWVTKMEELKQFLREQLKVNGKPVFNDHILARLIDIPLESIAMANKLEKAWLNKVEESLGDKSVYPSFYMMEIWMTVIKIKNHPIRKQIQFVENLRKEVYPNSKKGILRPPSVYLKGREPAIYWNKDREGSNEELQSLDWLYFFIFNRIANEPENILRDNGMSIECPISKKWKNVAPIPKICIKAFDLKEEPECAFGPTTSPSTVLSQSCPFWEIMKSVFLQDPFL